MKLGNSNKGPSVFDEVRDNSKCFDFHCHPECADGCWGAGNLSCIKCKNKAYFGRLKECIPTCHVKTNTTTNEDSINSNMESATSVQDGKLLYPEPDSMECMPCHELCNLGCTGPKKTECWDCKYAKMRNFIPKTSDDKSEKQRWTLECRAGYNCPDGYYLDEEKKYCEQCSTRCEDGCTGPGDFIGHMGCNACSSVTVPRDYHGSNHTTGSDLSAGLHCRLSTQVN